MKTFSSATYHARAIVLRVRVLGEKDRVMTLLSEERGKFDATARGARGAKGKLTGVAQPFILARFLVARGRSIDIATQAEIENAHPNIVTDLLKSAWATFCCELSSFLPEHLPEDELFYLLRDALSALDLAPPEQVESIGRWFEARYLALLGYAPQIGRCVSCDKKIVVPADDATRRLVYSPGLGGTLCGDCATRDVHRLSVNVQALRVLHRLSRADEPFPVELTGNARRNLRDCLQRGLLAHLEIKPKSRAFLDEVTDDLAIQTPVAETIAPPDASNDV